MIRKNIYKIIEKSFDYFGLQLSIDRKKNPHLNKKIALENIRLMSKILKKNYCEWWISHGTLLGMIREEDFISHDLDIDFSVSFDCLTKSLFQEITTEFELLYIFGDRLDCLELSFRRNGIKIDLFFVYKSGDLYRHSAFADFSDWGYQRYDYTFRKVEPREGEFLGLKVNIPRDAEMYLQEFYGKDWRLPKKRWLYFMDPPNVRRTELRYCRPLCEAEFLKWIENC